MNFRLWSWNSWAKTIEITQPQTLLRILESARYIFAHEAVCQNIEIYAPCRIVRPIFNGPPEARGIGIHAPDVTIEDPQGTGGTGIVTHAGSPRTTILGGRLHHCGVGIYAVSNLAPGAQGLVVEGTVIEDTIKLPDKDCHGFAAQNIDGAYLDFTVRRSAGDGAVLYHKKGGTMSNNTIKAKIEDVAGRAFDFGGDSGILPGTHQGDELELYAARCRVGLRLKAQDEWKVAGELVDCEIPIEQPGNWNMDMRALRFRKTRSN